MSKTQGKRGFVARQPHTAFAKVRVELEAVLAAEEAAERAVDRADDALIEAVPFPQELRYFECDGATRCQRFMREDWEINRRTPFADRERLQAILAKYREEKAAAAERIGVEAKRSALDSIKAGLKVDELVSTPAPDLDALAYKIRRLWHIMDDCWDPLDLESMSIVIRDPDAPNHRPGAALLAVYMDALRLTGRGEEATDLWKSITEYPQQLYPAQTPRKTPDYVDPDDGFCVRTWVEAFRAAGGLVGKSAGGGTFYCLPQEPSALDHAAAEPLWRELEDDRSKRELISYFVFRGEV